MREALVTWMQRRGWDAAAAACRACAEAAGERQQAHAAVMATGQLLPEASAPPAKSRVAVQT